MFRIFGAGDLNSLVFRIFGAGDPLVLHTGQELVTQEKPASFWTMYIKGHARSCTLLLLLHEALVVKKLNLAESHPKLFESCVRIIARIHAGGDMQTIAFANAALSARGAIRKAHDVLAWTLKLVKMQRHGRRPEVVLSEWNSRATKDRQSEQPLPTHIASVQSVPLPPPVWV